MFVYHCHYSVYGDAFLVTFKVLNMPLLSSFDNIHFPYVIWFQRKAPGTDRLG